LGVRCCLNNHAGQFRPRLVAGIGDARFLRSIKTLAGITDPGDSRLKIP